MVVGRRSFPFWETPFSGTFVVSFRESTFFGCQRSLCLRAYQVWANSVDFWIGFRWVVYVKNAYFFMGKIFPPLPQNKILVWRCKRILNIFHARWFNQSDLFGEWWNSVTLLNGWKHDLQRSGMKFGHIHSPGDCCCLNLLEAVIWIIQNVPRIPGVNPPARKLPIPHLWNKTMWPWNNCNCNG